MNNGYTQRVTRKQKRAKARMEEVGGERGLGALAKKKNLPGQGSFQQEQHEGQPAEQEDEVLAQSRGLGDSMSVMRPTS